MSREIELKFERPQVNLAGGKHFAIHDGNA